MKIHLIENSIIQYDNETINFGDLAITQGLSYYVTFFIKGNYLNWTPISQIRTTYVDSGGVVEAQFSFDTNIYDEQLGITYIRPYLKANITKSIISTLYQNKSNQSPSEDNCFLYTLNLINPIDANDIRPLIDTSLVQVKPGVTI